MSCSEQRQEGGPDKTSVQRAGRPRAPKTCLPRSAFSIPRSAQGLSASSKAGALGLGISRKRVEGTGHSSCHSARSFKGFAWTLDWEELQVQASEKTKRNRGVWKSLSH